MKEQSIITKANSQSITEELKLTLPLQNALIISGGELNNDLLASRLYIENGELTLELRLVIIKVSMNILALKI